jgi:hypothetical protein
MEKLDLTGLSESDVQMVKDLVEFLKNRPAKPENGTDRKAEYRSWPLGVKGPITRKEINDYL